MHWVFRYRTLPREDCPGCSPRSVSRNDGSKAGLSASANDTEDMAAIIQSTAMEQCPFKRKASEYTPSQSRNPSADL
ncbi:hypothetical protein VTL71DRAFT_15647 [Oculimacula yallundae]|uniref:Uncharacterized protein n=1 Tax=Oculimacula yallundae TaxID=86028 RepID=A0ABR4CH64_9HELO